MKDPSRLSRATASGGHALAAVVGLGLLCGAALAEEGGSGHYLPGSMSSFADSIPLAETFALRPAIIRYSASAGRQQPLPIAGITAVGADVSLWGLGLTVVWRPPVEIGPGWSWAMTATLPYLWMDVTANVGTGGLSVSRTSSTNAIGDVVLMPLMLNYNVDPDNNVGLRVGVYAPTGSYEVGRLANTGKNFWTIEPTFEYHYFGQKNGREATVFVGADFNQENSDTHYKSGTQFHVDGTLAQHFPFQGGLAGVGLSAYYYKQVTGDSGSGATLGDFKAQTVGYGPVASFVSKVGGHDVVAELKWLHESNTKNRLKGDIVWLKVLYKFY
jgi:hypothetical protein